MQTSPAGVFTVQVGSVTPFTFDWGSGPYFLQVWVDPDGNGTVDLGATQILSVPYALVAGRAIEDAVDDADADKTNEIQTLTIDGTLLRLEPDGGEVDISGGGVDLDPDPTNEKINNLSLNGTILQVSEGMNNYEVSLSPLQDGVEDDDPDPMNEKINSLKLSGTTLEIGEGSDSYFVDLSSLTGGGGSLWKDDPAGIYFDTKDVFIGDISTKPRVRLNSNVLNLESEYDSYYSSLTPHELRFQGGEFGNGWSSYLNENQFVVEGGWLDFTRETALDSSGIHVSYGSFLGTSSSWLDGNGLFLENDNGLQVELLSSYDASGELNFYNNLNYLGMEMGISENRGFQNIRDAVGDIMVSLKVTDESMNGGEIALRDYFEDVKARMYVNENLQGVLELNGMKSFVMPHPHQNDKEIVYACIEGPEVAAYDRGTAQLVDGEAFIAYSELTRIVIDPTTVTVTLTPHSADTYGLAVVEKTAEGFRVRELKNGTGNFAFDWHLTGVRNGYQEFQTVRKARLKGDMSEIRKEAKRQHIETVREAWHKPGPNGSVTPSPRKR